jgi:peptidylprolyl isomerase
MKRIFFIASVLLIASITGSFAKTKTEISEGTLLPKKKETMVLISTNFGDITIKLYNETPHHRDNFIKLVEEGFYDSTIFHRVITQFMIQGGDPDSKNAKPGQQLGNGGPGYEINPEFRSNLYHKRGALAAAREGDRVNPEKKSSGSQFYIVQGRVFTKEEMEIQMQRANQEAISSFFATFINDPKNLKYRKQVDSCRTAKDMDGLMKLQKELEELNKDEIAKISTVKFNKEQMELYTTVGGAPHLDGAYTVFGEVVSGIDVIDKIAAVEKDGSNRPLVDIKMNMKILK